MQVSGTLRQNKGGRSAQRYCKKQVQSFLSSPEAIFMPPCCDLRD